MTTGRRRLPKKPKGKEGLCWAWKKGHKARGIALEKSGKRAEAAAHRCHRLAGAESGRCYKHGGTSKSGKAHPNYKHGFYSIRYHGILARAGEAQESLEAAASYPSVDVARLRAVDCMHAHGGRDSYKERDRSDRGPHVVTSWDGGLPSGVPGYLGTTVWLERLEVVYMELPTEAEDLERECQSELMGRLDPDGVARISKRAYDELMIALECAQPEIIPDANDVATLGPYRVGPAADLKGLPGL